MFILLKIRQGRPTYTLYELEETKETKNNWKEKRRKKVSCSPQKMWQTVGYTRYLVRSKQKKTIPPHLNRVRLGIQGKNRQTGSQRKTKEEAPCWQLQQFVVRGSRTYTGSTY